MVRTDGEDRWFVGNRGWVVRGYVRRRVFVYFEVLYHASERSKGGDMSRVAVTV